jgi:hypothetical protein
MWTAFLFVYVVLMHSALSQLLMNNIGTTETYRRDLLPFLSLQAKDPRNQ